MATPRSLADDLRERSDAELTVLLRARPDLVKPNEDELGELVGVHVIARPADDLEKIFPIG